MPKIASHQFIVLLFFALFLGVGLFIVKDYGISYDEVRSRKNGIISLDYIVKKDQTLLIYGDRDYGTFFEIVLVALERGLHLTDNSRALYLMRHLVTFLLFYLGIIFFYLLCQKSFNSWQIALGGCLFLILSPRIFADAFYNSKDIPCLSLFIICTYTLINYLENKTFVNAFVHAFATSILIDIRIVGIIIPFLTIFLTTIDMSMMAAKKISFRKSLGSLFAYCFFLIVLIILFWPFLWSSPVKNFIYALLAMSHFRWDGAVFYFGKFIPASNLPWHYVPVWIAISTPLAYIITFFIGYVRIIISAGRNLTHFYRDRKNELIFLLLFSLPLLAVIALKSVVYDAWRQMFFIYPAFLLISLIGLRSLYHFIRGKPGRIFTQTILISLILFNLSSVALFMIRNHPFQNTYFNSLAGRNMKEIKSKFELDYWGLSYTKALEYIVSHDSDSAIKIYAEDRSWGLDTQMLNDFDRDRLVFVSTLPEAKYFLSVFRLRKEDYKFLDNWYQYINEYYSIKVDGAAIAVVYRLKIIL